MILVKVLCVCLFLHSANVSAASKGTKMVYVKKEEAIKIRQKAQAKANAEELVGYLRTKTGTTSR